MTGAITRAIPVNGWANVKTLLKTALAGYRGDWGGQLRIINNNATAATVHVNDSASQPASAADGHPIGTTAATAPLGAGILLENVDLSGVWVNTAGAQTLIFMVLPKY